MQKHTLRRIDTEALEDLVAAPDFEPSCLPATAGLNIVPLLATDVGVQPLDDLLADLRTLEARLRSAARSRRDGS